MLCMSKEWELKNEFLCLLQDNQIALRTAYLEEENSNLRDQFESLSNVNQEMRKSVEELKITGCFRPVAARIAHSRSVVPVLPAA